MRLGLHLGASSLESCLDKEQVHPSPHLVAGLLVSPLAERSPNHLDSLVYQLAQSLFLGPHEVLLVLLFVVPDGVVEGVLKDCWGTGNT